MVEILTKLLNNNQSSTSFDVEKVRKHFPILKQRINGKPLVYLDSAASSEKPIQVTQAITDYYNHDHANVHRGVHTLSQRATKSYEGAREKVQEFINSASLKEIIFLRGTTEAINLVAYSYGEKQLTSADSILITEMEHHANIVPWQIVCQKTGAKLLVARVNDRGEIDLEDFADKLKQGVKIAAFTHISNALGSINPIKQMIDMAHEVDAITVIDGAQAVHHEAVDMQALDCDFYAFSGHKMYGPTGIGVLYGKQAHLNKMSPYQSGGEMIKLVSFEKTTYADLPAKFEAGTPDIAGAVGLGAAIDYIKKIGMQDIVNHEQNLLNYATDQANSFQALKIIGTAEKKASVLSFIIDQIHPHDIGTILDSEGVAVRTGHHCAQPLMKRFNVPATVRASFGMYNTEKEVDILFKAIRKAINLFSGHEK